MGDGLQVFEIVLFALVAAFLVFRLRSVLGKRTGHEQFRDPFQRKPSAPPGPSPLIEGSAHAVDAVPPPANGVQKLKSADRDFDETAFLRGARAAFEIIVNAFAAADTAALKPLLSADVYRSFADAMAERVKTKETHETTLVTIKACETAEARLDGTIANVTVKFVSDQVNVTRGADGSVIEGDPDRIVEKTDYWTFARDTRSRDPNWQLVATRSA